MIQSIPPCSVHCVVVMEQRTIFTTDYLKSTMANGEQDAASLRWAIDQQKSDYVDIRNTLRKYLAVVISVVVAMLVAFFRGGRELFSNPLSTTLTQDGFLWQLNILPAKIAPVFTNTFTMYAAVVSGLGLPLIFLSLNNIVKIEQLPKCSPIGNAADLIEADIDTLERWVKENDELLQAVDQQRKSTLRIGRHGIVLTISSYFLEIAAEISGFVAVLIYIAIWIEIWHVFKHDNMLKHSRLKKAFISALILITFIQPLTEYQEVYGYFPAHWILLWNGIAVGIVLYYFRSDVVSISNRIHDRIMAQWPE